MALVGGECTGKSRLAACLGQALPAVVVSEQLRAFVAAHGRVPARDEQGDVLRAQIAAEDRALVGLQGTRSAEPGPSPAPRWVVSDAAALNTAVYSILYYGDESLVPVAVDRLRRCRLVVWCAPDFPWRAEPGVRDGPAARRDADGLIGRLLLMHRIPALRAVGPTPRRAAVVAAQLAQPGGR